MGVSKIKNFMLIPNPQTFFYIFFWRARECVGHIFAYVAHFVYSRDYWIRTLRAAVASRRAFNLATHLPLKLKFKKFPITFVLRTKRWKPHNLNTFTLIIFIEENFFATFFNGFKISIKFRVFWYTHWLVEQFFMVILLFAKNKVKGAPNGSKKWKIFFVRINYIFHSGSWTRTFKSLYSKTSTGCYYEL